MPKLKSRKKAPPKKVASGEIAQSEIKKRPGINNKFDLRGVINRRKRDLRKARYFRRFRAGQTHKEIHFETGAAIETIKKYIKAEIERRGIDYKKLVIEHKKNAKKNKGKPKVPAITTSKKTKIKIKSKEIVYAKPTAIGSRIAESQALKISAQIEAIELRGRSSAPSKAMLARDEIRILKNKRKILVDYMYGELDVNHKVARFLSGLK